MLKFDLPDFWNLVSRLQAHSTNLYMADSMPESPLSSEEIAEMLKLLKDLEQQCLRFELPISRAAISRALKDHPRTEREFEMLLNSVKDEISGKLFVFIPPHRARYFEKTMLWQSAFPNAANDMKEAGNSYAAGLFTACVYYCMRVLEYGLRALATNVNITPPKPIDSLQWQGIIDLIEKEIRSKRISPGVSNSDSQIVFWTNAAAQFFIFKEAWRNATMHVRANYTENEAQKIIDAVDEFMSRLSNNGLSE